VATSVVISTSVGYRQVEVTNLAATANMFCAERTTVSTSSGVLVGYKIAAGASKIFPIVPFTDFYCINDSGSASQWAVVRRGR
jgi:hypothetical protein